MVYQRLRVGDEHPAYVPAGAWLPFFSCQLMRVFYCLSSSSNRVLKKYGADQAVVTVVGYYFCDEPIPYRTTIAGKNVTLGQFKQHIAKKGNYRFVLSSAIFIWHIYYDYYSEILFLIKGHSIFLTAY